MRPLVWITALLGVAFSALVLMFATETLRVPVWVYAASSAAGVLAGSTPLVLLRLNTLGANVSGRQVLRDYGVLLFA